MREAILTLFMCLNMATTVYAQSEEVTVEPVTINIEEEVQNKIDELDKSDLKQWFIQYKQIQEEYSDRLDPDESIYDCISQEEIEFIWKIVQAEIDNGNFIQKVNVADAIVNRYRSEKFPNTFTKILTQKVGKYYQFTTYANGAYKKAKVTDETILAVEFAFQMPDLTQGATYFHSGKKSSFHQNKLDFIMSDGKHNFYREK